MKQEFTGDCPCCHYYFSDLYDHISCSEMCFNYLVNLRDRVNNVIEWADKNKKVIEKNKKELDVVLDRIVLTNHGYWCRKRDVPIQAKIVKESVYLEFPDPVPDWMRDEAKYYSEVGIK